MIYKINNIEMPSNSKMEVGMSDLDNKEGTGRTESGYAFRDRLRVGVRQLTVEYVMLTDSEIATVLDALDAEFFPVEYKDPQHGVITKTFYVGDRTAPLEVLIDGVAGWNLKFDLVEQ